MLTLATGGNDKKVTKKPDKGRGQQKSQPAASENKGKRKAPPVDDSTETIESASDAATKPTKSKTAKNQTKSKESHPTDADGDPDDAAGPKKKKMRKLNVNIFGSAKPDSLDWANQFNLVSHIAVRDLCRSGNADAIVQGGSDIPTQLSPMKVPPRSLARKSTSSAFRKS